MNTPRILVTGGTGTVGRELVQALTHFKLDFSVMSSTAVQSANGVSYVQGDFADIESLKQVFQGYDRLFLLLPVAPQQELFATNAIEAARAAGIGHIVRSSSWRADPSSDVSMARMQGQTNALLSESGITWTVLRPNMFMQNLVNFHAGEIRAGAVHAPHGNGAMGLIDVRDIAGAAAAILAAPEPHAGKTYDLTGPEALTDAQQLEIVSRALGREVRYVDIPEATAEDAMRGMGLPAIVIDWLMGLNRAAKQGFFSDVTGDVLQLTGHPPRHFVDFVNDHIATWR
ncbi:SDR family oxidoreductase [Rhizobium sp. M1]|uniref:SDR family oxidoreductase n=1 Tax=Rhizobium sp. M1 TaxID=2035453 RepID=UPI000BE8B53B|nr:SDR family oxidoreductase [Rhizobium sp. M1]PDT08984.1 NAD(P)-dependent oxidoreductase [Rhizobium sp. M1]